MGELTVQRCELCGRPATVRGRGVRGGPLPGLRLMFRRWVWLCTEHTGEELERAMLGAGREGRR